jgi:hypothetical protein
MDSREKEKLVEKLELDKSLMESGLSEEELEELSQEMVEKMKKLKRQTIRIGGYTFPGVTDK